MDDIHASTRANEQWLRATLGAEVVEADLVARRAKLADKPFTYLRAAYWRWVELLPESWGPKRPGMAVLAVGDVHLENFGTWRDGEGRLVWGVNDFDEAAVMPWPLDLLRLATSAHMAHDDPDAGDAATDAVATAIMDGYTKGLKRPRPIILDHDFAWLRQTVLVARSAEDQEAQEKARKKFWKKMLPPDEPPPTPPARLLSALRGALPQGATEAGLWPRRAGAGSLGRPRWVMRAKWQGGPILREAKAMLPSAWVRVHADGPIACRAAEAATGAYRAPDPCQSFLDGVAVRRLSPNNQKFEAGKHPEILFDQRMLKAMGRDLAAVHAATTGAARAIAGEIAARMPLDAEGKRLAEAARQIAQRLRRDQAEVPRSWRSKA